ncbi:thioester reductase domain-containing protein [Streptomyces sp. B1866]|uniref:thioester reductase domain-containing protein n=1 Tax=Streptomyces sp. B1866 TaxID=3075431 RepID=UPI002892130C|nr:thioester reductase domain-containing protein [Streptomyces sp. B1866]MDT3396002.1 thioester reductase domain-containing protein [Streptomyces sp. B1866]
MYRTGDIARWCPDGVIEFRGRRDRQVKISGYRVELDEVETVLAAHPAVREALVDVLGEGSARRLVGAVVAAPGTELQALPRRLDAHARDRLPSFMVPSAIAVVPRIPLTPHGKPDRGALGPLTARRSGTGVREEPRDDRERAVAQVWADQLDVDHVFRRDNFFSLGGDSLRAGQVVPALCDRLGIAVPAGRDLLHALVGNPTLADFAAFTRRLPTSGARRDTDDGVDFAAEAVLDPRLRPAAGPAGPPALPATVLLTGATGFLGAHLLDRLTRDPAHLVYCLVRASGAEAARDRLAAGLHHHGLPSSAAWRDRVRPVPADLAAPRAGLADDLWNRLADEADAVLHAGARVNLLYPYRHLAPVNVGGTRAILRLAAEHRPTAVHFVSTMDVLSGTSPAGVREVAEDTPLGHPELLPTGYAQSKWVAERLVAQGAERGLPAAIHRPYEIAGTRAGANWNTGTMVCALLRAIADTGAAPALDIPLDLIPVDYTAEVVVRLLRQGGADGRVYHVTNPRPARLDLAVDRLRAMGYAVRTRPYRQWSDQIARLAVSDPGHPVAPYLPLLLDRGRPDGGCFLRRQESFPRFRRTNVPGVLRRDEPWCPPVDARLVDSYLRCLRAGGFLAAPDACPRTGS